ncbi:MAG: hypothetical protein K2F69_03010 [Bacteroidaceae bacterium]|nr:hypothetical protein [Bacteroidaceae bacterium]
MNQQSPPKDFCENPVANGPMGVLPSAEIREGSSPYFICQRASGSFSWLTPGKNINMFLKNMNTFLKKMNMFFPKHPHVF